MYIDSWHQICEHFPPFVSTIPIQCPGNVCWLPLPHLHLYFNPCKHCLLNTHPPQYLFDKSDSALGLHWLPDLHKHTPQSIFSTIIYLILSPHQYLLTNLTQHPGNTGVAWLTGSEAVDQFHSQVSPFQVFLPISITNLTNINSTVKSALLSNIDY